MVLTTSGRNIMLNRTFKSSPDYAYVQKFKVGVDQTTPSLASTDLDNKIPIKDTEELDNCETAGNWSATTDGSITLNSTTYKVGAGSLNLIKSGTTVNNVTYYNNNNMTSRDFTNKDLWVWIYIIDSTALAKLATTDALEIRLGNDYNTNYYYKKYDNSDLSVGWNYFKLNTTNMTEVGSVTLTSVDSGAVKLTFTATSDTLIAGDILTDDWKLASVSDYEKDFESTSFNETNTETTLNCFLNAVQSVGYLINGVATYNDDATDKISSIFKFTAKSKSNQDEINFIVRNRIVSR